MRKRQDCKPYWPVTVDKNTTIYCPDNILIPQKPSKYELNILLFTHSISENFKDKSDFKYQLGIKDGHKHGYSIRKR